MVFRKIFMVFRKVSICIEKNLDRYSENSICIQKNLSGIQKSFEAVFRKVLGKQKSFSTGIQKNKNGNQKNHGNFSILQNTDFAEYSKPLFKIWNLFLFKIVPNEFLVSC